MNSSPPRLPRLGGHRSSPPRKPTPAATTPSGPSSLYPSARIEPARASNSPERPYIDVGYDDDVPLAQPPVHLLASLRGTPPSSPHQQARSPPRSGRPSSSPSLSPSASNMAEPSWKEQVKSEVLQGLGGQIGSSPSPRPSATAPARCDEQWGDDDDPAAGRDAMDVGEPAPSHLLPSMPAVLSTAATFAAAAATSPVIPITNVPKSPASVASSLATDTPRSILRHPGQERGAPSPRSRPRRISFVDLSPLRDSNSSNSSDQPHRKRRESLSVEENNEDDEYDFAEPLLRYETETPPVSVRNAAQPAIDDEDDDDARMRGNASTPRSSSSSPSRSPDRRGSAAAVTKTQRGRSPDKPEAVACEMRRSPSSSPERPIEVRRSPTRSPPRKGDQASPRCATRTAISAVAASAPPPPEEENDVVTLDRTSPPRLQPQQQQQQNYRSPNRACQTAEKKSPAREASAGHDEDILTQPHQHGRSAPHGMTATPGGRRPSPRRRWPSDAYVDEPPTEVSTTQRVPRGGGRRESLDPEDDMGSTTSHSSSGDTSHDEYSSDDGPSFHYESPVKAAGTPRRTSSGSGANASADYPRSPSPTASSLSRSPLRHGGARDQTKSPIQRQPRSPSSRLPERRPSKSVSGSRASSVVSGHHSSGHSSNRERPIPSTPQSLTEGLDSGMLRHRRSPSREERTASSLQNSTLLPLPVDDSCATKRGDAATTMTATSSREVSHSGSHGRWPSAITNDGSDRSVEEGVAPQMPPSLALAGPAAVAVKEVAKRKKKVERDEPQVYVDPLLRERQHHHSVARQQSPTHRATRAPLSGDVMPLLPERETAVDAPRARKRHSPRHVGVKSRVEGGGGGGAFEPLSLRDIMARHDSPAATPKRPLSSRQLSHTRTSSSSSAAASLSSTRKKAEAEETKSESSRLSSGGVPAEELVWDAPTPSSRASSASPPASHGSLASAVTSGRHRVFRKKLVTVVRRRRSGAPPSEDDPVVRMSIVPYREGSPAVLEAEARQEALRHDREAPTGGSRSNSVSSRDKDARTASRSTMGAVSATTAVGAPPLERLIDHIHPGRASSVSTRRSSRNTHIREDRAGEREEDDSGAEETDVVTEEDRRQFRHTLSTLSSLCASRRSSAARSRRSDSAMPAVEPPHSTKEEEEDNHLHRHHHRHRRSSSTTHTTTTNHSEGKTTSRRSSVNAAAQLSISKQKTPQPSSPSVSRHTPKPESTVTVAPPSVAATLVAGKEGPGDTASSRKDESTMTRARHHHHHRHPSTRRESTHATSKAPQRSGSTKLAGAASSPRSLSAEQAVPPAPTAASAAPTSSLPTLPDAPYRPTQNDEFYYGADTLANEVAQLRQRDASQRIGITPVVMPLLPRLTFAADQTGGGPRDNADAQGVAAWSTSDNDEDGDENACRSTGDPQIADGGASYDGSHRRRRLLLGSATQTDRFGPVTAGSRGVGRMPFTAAAAPVLRPSFGTNGGVVSNTVPAQAVTVTDAPLTVAASAPVSALQQERSTVPGVGEPTVAVNDRRESATVATPAEDESESPMSFVKRKTTPAAKASARRGAAPATANVGFAGAPPVEVANQLLQRASAPLMFGQPPCPSQVMTTSPSPYAAAASNNMLGGASPPPETASIGVPLFVPSLTVDNVSHLTQDWQSTLRERAGKAKQSAMEQFLIASAEAGAASTLSGTHPNHNSVNNGNRSGSGGPAYGAGVPPDWEARRWSAAPVQPGLPASEYYGQPQPLAATTTTVPLAAHALPPRLLPQAFWEAEREARQQAAAARVAASSKRKASVSFKPAASSPTTKNETQRQSTSLSPQAEALDLVEAGDADERSSRGSNTPEKADSVEPLSPPRSLATRRLTPPTAAALASEQSPFSQHRHHSHSDRDVSALLSPLADPVKSTDRAARQKKSKADLRTAATAAAIATATQGRHDSDTRGTAGFTIAEPEPSKSKRRDKHDDGNRHPRHGSAHPTRRRGRSRSVCASSAASHHTEKHMKDTSRKAKEVEEMERKKRKGKEEKAASRHRSSRGKRRHTNSHRRTPSTTASSTTSSSAASSNLPFSITDMYSFPHRMPAVDADASDVDSSMATSMEFQLSRLRLQREKEVSLALASLQEEQEKAEARRQRKAEKVRAAAAAAAAEKRRGSRLHRHRTSSSGGRSPKNSESDDESSRSRSSGEKKEKRRKRKEKEKRKEQEERKKKHKENKRRRSLSAATKKSKKSEKSKSASKHGPSLLSPPPPLSREREAWGDGGFTSPYDRPVPESAESRFSSPPYESIGASRYNTVSSPYTRQDYAANTPFFGAGSDAESRWSHFRSRSNGIDNNNNTGASRYTAASPYSNYRRVHRDYFDNNDNSDGDAAGSSRYARRRSYTSLSASRWADTPRYFSDGDVSDHLGTSPAASSAYEPSARKHSHVVRPSTRWADYVREAKRQDQGATSAAAFSAASFAGASRYTSFGQQRSQSSGGDMANAWHSPTSGARYSSSYARHRTDDYDDIDDIPKRSYFNDEGTQPRFTSHTYTTSATTGGRRRQNTSSTTDNVPPSSYRRQRRGTANATTQKEEDILVSTPSQDKDEGDGDSSYDYWEDQGSRQPQRRRGAPPPPPTPPGESPAGSTTRTPSTSDQDFMRVAHDARGSVFASSKALPIVTEHAVTNAQAAHDFAEGVRSVVGALRHYKEQSR